MAISMHSASVPIFVRLLNNMLAWLDKAEAHAKAKGFDTENYLGLRLSPDMLPFSRQIHNRSNRVGDSTTSQTSPSNFSTPRER